MPTSVRKLSREVLEAIVIELRDHLYLDCEPGGEDYLNPLRGKEASYSFCKDFLLTAKELMEKYDLVPTACVPCPEEHMPGAPSRFSFPSAVDWSLLYKQKCWLEKKARQSTEAQGLLNLVDAIQDAAVDQGIAAEDEVFPLLKTPDKRRSRR